MWVIFALLDPDPLTRLNPDPDPQPCCRLQRHPDDEQQFDRPAALLHEEHQPQQLQGYRLSEHHFSRLFFVSFTLTLLSCCLKVLFSLFSLYLFYQCHELNFSLRPGYIHAYHQMHVQSVSWHSPFKPFFRSRWGVNNNNQYNEDKAGIGATICPSEAGGWPTQPIAGRHWTNWEHNTLIKKKIKFSSYIRKFRIPNRAVAKSYMANGLLIYGEIFAHFLGY